MGPLSLKKEVHLSNYGIRDRDPFSRLIGEAVSLNPLLKHNAYRKVEDWAMFIKNAESMTRVPSITLAAILYEEQIHRKPLDIRTFGPAQMGLGELREQGLPEDKALLKDPETSILILARKLKRLEVKTGSLDSAITLHNGYSDFAPKVKARQRDRRLVEIINVLKLRKTVFV